MVREAANRCSKQSSKWEQGWISEQRSVRVERTSVSQMAKLNEQCKTSERLAIASGSTVTRARREVKVTSEVYAWTFRCCWKPLEKWVQEECQHRSKKSKQTKRGKGKVSWSTSSTRGMSMWQISCNENQQQGHWGSMSNIPARPSSHLWPCCRRLHVQLTKWSIKRTSRLKFIWSKACECHLSFFEASTPRLCRRLCYGIWFGERPRQASWAMPNLRLVPRRVATRPRECFWISISRFSSVEEEYTLKYCNGWTVCTFSKIWIYWNCFSSNLTVCMIGFRFNIHIGLRNPLGHCFLMHLFEPMLEMLELLKRHAGDPRLWDCHFMLFVVFWCLFVPRRSCLEVSTIWEANDRTIEGIFGRKRATFVQSENLMHVTEAVGLWSTFYTIFSPSSNTKRRWEERN